jgi:hypothetical protein
MRPAIALIALCAVAAPEDARADEGKKAAVKRKRSKRARSSDYDPASAPVVEAEDGKKIVISEVTIVAAVPRPAALRGFIVAGPTTRDRKVTRAIRALRGVPGRDRALAAFGVLKPALDSESDATRRAAAFALLDASSASAQAAALAALCPRGTALSKPPVAADLAPCKAEGLTAVQAAYAWYRLGETLARDLDSSYLAPEAFARADVEGAPALAFRARLEQAIGLIEQGGHQHAADALDRARELLPLAGDRALLVEYLSFALDAAHEGWGSVDKTIAQARKRLGDDPQLRGDVLATIAKRYAWAPDVEALTKAAADATASPQPVEHANDAWVWEAVVRSHPALLRCARGRRTSGSIALDVDADGRVTAGKARGLKKTVADCVAAIAEGWTLDVPELEAVQVRLVIDVGSP